ncbi:MAG: hypothetical protein UU85_C0004G0108 [Candidatus Wolfebacteria bacterium GW2011_GWA2_42_10]|uniref:Uncharacterized protein n=2 Tax=Candidatus Wolfeibacteriota TaxID=1752735 RepID=A0A0G0XKC1_9BACT|nr:MAG: hypothetical protein UU38_C0001G0169 [Candidatus Wolfebacteria bacterium GW2011_GWB1_41_12]KKS25349.1 MAG: hypothetical protein UU85_C0004G0108 [Candidatus Wolfebacteria bacterium GW2011_GWA2_42_10]KKT56788.1 MAG: hypothetical protein UW50_C0001G0357 [Candidatus Wolfebacteria bacterium GW2011_GWA1_44_24]
MRLHIPKLKTLVFLFSAFCFLLSAFGANAQTAPQFLVSWKAQSYVPSWYQGKIFPTNGSRIDVNFELIDNGKIADISKKVIRWYVNDELMKNEKNGLGIKSFSFNAADYPGKETEIRIAMPDYWDVPLDKIFIIPIVSPEVVIDAPYPSRRIPADRSSFLAYPFFFNIGNSNSLSFEWFVNDQSAKAGENPSALNLNIDSTAPKGFAIDIKVVVKNLLNEMEFAGKNIKMEIK